MLFCFISIYAGAKTKNISEKNAHINKIEIYQGDRHISEKGFVKKIDSTCAVINPYGSGKTQKEVDNERAKCILSKMTFNYKKTINEMKLNEKLYLPSINGVNIFLKKTKSSNNRSIEDMGVEVKLFTEVNNQVVDNIISYYEIYDINGYYVEFQYYFINKFIYILKVDVDEEGTSVDFWEKYSINKNGKLNLVDSFRCHYELDKNICH